LESIGRYETGMKIGEWNYYYQNGKLEHLEIYNKYKRYSGEWKFYNEQGTLIKTETYTDGKETGDWKFYDEKGHLIKTQKY